MSSVPESTPASQPAVGPGPEAREEREPNLPVRELDRALAPVRRVVRFATGPQGHAARYLGVNLAPHVARAMRLELPETLRAWILDLGEAVDGFDGDPPAAQRERLSRMFAALARIDTVVGLPVPHRIRPVPKVSQIDEPEPADVEPPDGDAGGGPADPDRAGPDPADPDRADPEQDGDEDDGPEEFLGDLGQLWDDLAPNLTTALAEAGVRTVGDLLLRRPTVAEELTPIHGAGGELPEGRVAVGGRIRSGFTVYRAHTVPQRWSVVSGAGPVRVRWADPAPEGWGQRDRKVVVVGTHVGGVIQDAAMAAPDDQTVRLASWGIPGVPDAAVRELIAGLAVGIGQLRDPVPAETLRPLHLPGLAQALTQAHTAVSEIARRRLAFDEVLLAQLAAGLHRLQTGRDRGIAQPVLHGLVGRLSQVQGLELYDDAQAHLEEIKRDLRRQAPMRRLLTGEVGAGKGRLALIAAAMVAEAKGQVLIVCADAAEAEARFIHSDAVLRDIGLVARLIGSSPGSARRSQLDAVKRGEVHLVFGTMELLDEPIEFRRLGLVVAVEREGFGRACALHAALPAPRPDLIVVTAIPVGPRVLLTAYSDLQVSVVVDPERRPARIVVCHADARSDAYAEARDAVGRGEQALVVFPMVDGRDALELPDARHLLGVLEAEAFAGLRLGLLHGQMTREERARASDDLIHRRIDVLVCTTRAEEGPAVRSLSVVIIEQADRVDQWRLHRIIGFASRCGPRQAKAFLVVGELAEPDAAARIERVVSARNGFQLTEALVELRGVERVVSGAAPPLPSFAWFDPGRDLDLLLAARDEVHRVLRADPALRRGSHVDLARELRARWDRLFRGREGWPCLIREDLPAEPRRRRRRRRRRR